MTEARRRFRINSGVKPYSGKVIEARLVTEHDVTGFVVVGKRGYATAERIYRLDEVTEVVPAMQIEPEIVAAPGR